MENLSRQDKKSEDLYRLISKMNPSEKRYFKIYTSRQSNNSKIYQELFSIIEKSLEYNEDEVRRLFISKTKSKNFNEAKLNLRKILKRCLHEFYVSNSNKEILNIGVHFSKILYKKGLIKDSLGEIDKVYKSANDQSDFIMMMKSSFLKRQIIEATYGRGTILKNTIYQMLNKEKLLLSKHSNYLDYLGIYNQILDLLYYSGLPRTTQEQSEFFRIYKDSDLLVDETKALSDESLIVYYEIRALCCLIENKANESLEYIKKKRDYLNKQPAYLNEHIDSYLEFFVSQSVIYKWDRRDSQTKQLLIEFYDLLNNYRIRNQEANSDWSFFRYNTMLLAFFAKDTFVIESSNCIKELNRIIELLPNHIGKTRPDIEDELYYRISIAFYYCGMNKEAINYIVKVINRNNIDNHYLYYSKLFHLILMFEKNPFDKYIEYEITTLKRYLNSRFYNTPIEDTLLLEFIAKSNQEKLNPKLFLEKALAAKLNHKFEKNLDYYFNHYKWMIKQITG